MRAHKEFNVRVGRDGTIESTSTHFNVKNPQKQRTDDYGYSRVWVRNTLGSRKFVAVHRLVADCYIENCYNKPQVNHIDGNKSNNNASNLEWATPKENERHAIKTLGKNKTKARNKFTMNDISFIRFLLGDNGCAKAAKIFERCVDKSISISFVKNIKNNKHGKFSWI